MELNEQALQDMLRKGSQLSAAMEQRRTKSLNEMLDVTYFRSGLNRHALGPQIKPLIENAYNAGFWTGGDAFFSAAVQAGVFKINSEEIPPEQVKVLEQRIREAIARGEM